MTINEGFIKEMEQESKSAREMLKRIPPETFDWKPHEKSMTMKRLAVLVADMFGWFSLRSTRTSSISQKATRWPIQ